MRKSIVVLHALFSIIFPFIWGFPLQELTSVQPTARGGTSIVKRAARFLNVDGGDMSAADRAFVEAALAGAWSMAFGFNNIPHDDENWNVFMGDEHERVQLFIRDLVSRIRDQNLDYEIVRVPSFPGGQLAGTRPAENRTYLSDAFFQLGSIGPLLTNIRTNKNQQNNHHQLGSLMQSSASVLFHEMTHLFSTGLTQPLRLLERQMYPHYNVPRALANYGVRGNPNWQWIKMNGNGAPAQNAQGSFWNNVQDVRMRNFLVTNDQDANSHDTSLYPFLDMGYQHRRVVGPEAVSGYGHNVFVLPRLRRGTIAAAMNADSIVALVSTWAARWRYLPASPSVQYTPPVHSSHDSWVLGPNAHKKPDDLARNAPSGSSGTMANEIVKFVALAKAVNSIWKKVPHEF